MKIGSIVPVVVAFVLVSASAAPRVDAASPRLDGVSRTLPVATPTAAGPVVPAGVKGEAAKPPVTPLLVPATPTPTRQDLKRNTYTPTPTVRRFMGPLRVFPTMTSTPTPTVTRTPGAPCVGATCTPTQTSTPTYTPTRTFTPKPTQPTMGNY